MDAKKSYGMLMQISNNSEYLKAVENYSQVMQTDFLSIEMRVYSLANTIGQYANSSKRIIDANNINFLTKSYLLGKIDGGEPTLNYINNKLDNKVSEYEIMMNRLNKIFGFDFFTEEEIKELKNLYGNDRNYPESYIVRLSYLLEMAYCHLVKDRKYDWINLKKDIINLGRKIGEYYRDNQDFKFTQDINNLIKETIESIPKLDEELQNGLDELINKYTSGEINKPSFIDEISSITIYEKKNNSGLVR